MISADVHSYNPEATSVKVSFTFWSSPFRLPLFPAFYLRSSGLQLKKIQFSATLRS